MPNDARWVWTCVNYQCVCWGCAMAWLVGSYRLLLLEACEMEMPIEKTLQAGTIGVRLDEDGTHFWIVGLLGDSTTIVFMNRCWLLLKCDSDQLYTSIDHFFRYTKCWKIIIVWLLYYLLYIVYCTDVRYAHEINPHWFDLIWKIQSEFWIVRYLLYFHKKTEHIATTCTRNDMSTIISFLFFTVYSPPIHLTWLMRMLSRVYHIWNTCELWFL